MDNCGLGYGMDYFMSYIYIYWVIILVLTYGFCIGLVGYWGGLTWLSWSWF